ncbi:hypothetical protein EON66_11510, partial [archaeon]
MDVQPPRARAAAHMPSALLAPTRLRAMACLLRAGLCTWSKLSFRCAPCTRRRVCAPTAGSSPCFAHAHSRSPAARAHPPHTAAVVGGGECSAASDGTSTRRSRPTGVCQRVCLTGGCPPTYAHTHVHASTRARRQCRIRCGAYTCVCPRACSGWCMHDEANPDYVSMIDQTTLGNRWLAQEFGPQAVPRVTWQIDPFGHSAVQG